MEEQLLNGAPTLIIALYLLIQFLRNKNDAVATLTASLNAALASLVAQTQRVDALETEKGTWNAERIALENRLDELADQMRKARLDADEANTRLGQEQIRIKGELAKAHRRIKQLEQEAERKDARIEQLKVRMETLEAELRAREQELGQKQAAIENLELALVQSEQAVGKLQKELAPLEAKLNGKADRAPETGGETTATPGAGGEHG